MATRRLLIASTVSLFLSLAVGTAAAYLFAEGTPCLILILPMPIAFVAGHLTERFFHGAIIGTACGIVFGAGIVVGILLISSASSHVTDFRPVITWLGLSCSSFGLIGLVSGAIGGGIFKRGDTDEPAQDTNAPPKE